MDPAAAAILAMLCALLCTGAVAIVWEWVAE